MSFQLVPVSLHHGHILDQAMLLCLMEPYSQQLLLLIKISLHNDIHIEGHNDIHDDYLFVVVVVNANECNNDGWEHEYMTNPNWCQLVVSSVQKYGFSSWTCNLNMRFKCENTKCDHSTPVIQARSPDLEDSWYGNETCETSCPAVAWCDNWSSFGQLDSTWLIWDPWWLDQ